MPTEFSRHLRVAQELKRILAPWIQQKAKDAQLGMVTLTAVEVTPDLRQAKIYITSLGAKSHSEEVVARLNQSKGILRHYLSQHLRLRTVPRLMIVFDESIERGARISALLDALSEENTSGLPPQEEQPNTA
ncbi:MAG TPA: 30S ribosome-binding factor RbfA [Gammaproteobacteria bacterium]|jgi:ribosome-binding factor A|nr:30S ribosome-binding factor RbfA [Gammaproteobacteria bacterium]HEX2245479.1 30S ribosome-binding factor RbfA [Gammaproteobacteria bacterium]